jgi:hypothetical protein
MPVGDSMGNETEGNSFVQVRALPVMAPPIPETGGRIQSDTGETARFANGDQFLFAAYIEFLPGVTRLRGNHYHSERTETLYIARGTLRAIYYDLDSGATQEEMLHAGHLVTIRPRCAHAYLPLEYSQAIELADTAYDASDTISYDLTNYLDRRK